MNFKYIFLFSIFFLLGCHPIDMSGLLSSSSVSSPYATQNTQYYASYDNNDDEEFIKTRLLDTLFDKMICGHFKQELLDYFRFILFHIKTPTPDLFNAKMENYVVYHFSNKIDSHKLKLISTMLSKMYQTSFDFVQYKTNDVALEEWSLVERIYRGYGRNVSGSAFKKEYKYLDQINNVYDKLSRLMKSQYLCDREETSDQKYSVTVREGMNIFQVADTLHMKHIVSKKEFLRICQDTQLIKQLLGDEDISSLEGYLYPGKYSLGTGDTTVTLVKKMVYRFLHDYNFLKSQYRPHQLSRHEIVTLASMIEKEAVLKHEKPMIASVFFNRLAIGMRLQSDPTVRYGVWRYTGYRPKKLSKKHFSQYNHYNTYQMNHLPKDPISNPGYSALHAVFNPDTTPYYFFVSRGDGRTHNFSVTFEEHLDAVATYRRVKSLQTASAN